MKNVLLLGDSHLAAIKLAYEATREKYPGISASFLGLRGQHINAMTLHHGKLWIKNPLARRQIFSNRKAPVMPLDLAGFDQIALFGMGLNIFRLLQIYSRYRSDAHGFRDEKAFLVSNECFNAASDGYLRMSKAVKLGEALASQLQKPVYLSVQPMPSKSITQYPDYASLAKGVEFGDDNSLAGNLENFVKSYSFKGITILPQPPDTLESPMFTRHDYCRGSVRLTNRLDEPHPDDDFSHMNTDYGIRILEDFFAQAGLI